MYYNKIYL